MGPKRGAKDRKLYRRKWEDVNNPLVAEARMQTLALQRLSVWLRLAYSVLAMSALVGYWGFSGMGPLAAGIAGAVVGVVALLCTIVLRTGIANGRSNVNKMLDALEGVEKSD